MYAGERETTQYQSIPMAPQLNPSHAGGVITLQRHYQGIDSRWTHRGELGGSAHVHYRPELRKHE